MKLVTASLAFLAPLSGAQLGDGDPSKAIPGGGPEPVLQNFLHAKPIGDSDVLVYRLDYPAVSGGLPATGMLPLSRYGSQIPEEAAATFFNTVENVFYSNSYDTVTIDLDVLGSVSNPLVMPEPLSYYSNSCPTDPLRLLADARSEAMKKDKDWRDYDYEVILTKDFGAANFNKNFRVSFCAESGDNLFDLLLHEMGHGFKFEHASYWDGDPALVCEDEVTQCPAQCPKEDEFDAMANVQNNAQIDVRHYNLRHKLWAGWIASNRVPTIRTDGEYTIKKFEDPVASGKMGIRVRRDPEWTYNVVYRGAAEVVASSGAGALITRSRKSNLRPSGDTVLINPHDPECSLCDPDADNWETAVLLLGETFDDGDISFEVTSVTPTEIKVQVEFDDSPLLQTTQAPIDRLPVINILSPSPGDELSGTVQIEITAFDPDVQNAGLWDGIDRIELGIGSDETGGGCGPTGSYAICQTFTNLDPTNPIVYSFDTAQICDGFDQFVVEAYSDLPAASWPIDPCTGLATQPFQKIRFRFLVDNQNLTCDGCPL